MGVHLLTLATPASTPNAASPSLLPYVYPAKLCWVPSTCWTALGSGTMKTHNAHSQGTQRWGNGDS